MEIRPAAPPNQPTYRVPIGKAARTAAEPAASIYGHVWVCGLCDLVRAPNQ